MREPYWNRKRLFRDHSRHTHFRGEGKEDKTLGNTSPQESSISARDGKQVSALALAAEGTLRNEIPGMSRKYSEETSGNYYGAEKWCTFHLPSLVSQNKNI